jgi:outer membrane protein TolC
MGKRSAKAATALFAGLAVVAFLCAPNIRAQDLPDSAPLLTLNQAIEISIADNLTLKIAGLEINKAKFDVAATKTKRLPALQTYLFGSVLITPVNFTFPVGAFGTYKNVGPIPGMEQKITTPAGTLNTYALAQAAQPLSQLYKLHLGIREKELSVDLDSEKYREQRQNVVKQVKQAYYSILQSQSALQAAQASVKQYEELDRVMSEKLSQEAALKSDSMEVKAKLAQERYNVLQLTDQLQSRREQLNDLLGRDLATAFRTEDVPAMAAEESDLRAAQQTALSKRPEIRQAEINVQQADYDRRLAKAQYIPDVAVAVHYTSPFNVEFVPKNIVAAGFELNWEPFDWGRRKDEINQKKIVLDQSQLQLKDVQSKVLLDVDNRFRTLQETRVLLTVAKTAADAATEKLREMTQKFGQQSVLLRDVLQQQAAVASANSNYEQALLSFWTSKAEFEKAVGEDR